MGSLRVKLYDKNRYAKRYPLIRAPARMTYVGVNDLNIEVGSVYFDNVDSGTLFFDAPFADDSFQVIAMQRDACVDSADVNIHITALDKTSVTIGASSIFTGYVDVFAVRIT